MTVDEGEVAADVLPALALRYESQAPVQCQTCSAVRLK